MKYRRNLILEELLSELVSPAPNIKRMKELCSRADIAWQDDPFQMANLILNELFKFDETGASLVEPHL